MNEHPSEWFNKRKTKSIRSPVLFQLVDMGDMVKKTKLFKVMYWIPIKFSDEIEIHLLHITKATTILTDNPSAYV